MKRALPSLLLCSLLFASFTSDTISFKREKVEQVKVVLNTVYQYLDQSQLPHTEVKQLLQGISIAANNLGDTIAVPKDTTRKDSTQTKKKK